MPKISIIIPFHDHVGLLRRCLKSISEKTSYLDYEILLVDNNSSDKETAGYLKSISGDSKISIVEYNKPFNFSAINNFAAEQVSGEFLLFLNNDIEVISGDWLQIMLAKASRPEVGAVGARLLYPDGSIQHAGIMMHPLNGPIHAFSHFSERDFELIAKEYRLDNNWSAVTGACLMTRRELFLKLGGFDQENLPIAYNDVDYCLRLIEQNFQILLVSQAKLYHHESASRSSDLLAGFFKGKRYKQFRKEQSFMGKKWGKNMQLDPFFSSAFIKKENKFNKLRRLFS